MMVARKNMAATDITALTPWFSGQDANINAEGFMVGESNRLKSFLRWVAVKEEKEKKKEKKKGKNKNINTKRRGKVQDKWIPRKTRVCADPANGLGRGRRLKARWYVLYIYKQTHPIFSFSVLAICAIIIIIILFLFLAVICDSFIWPPTQYCSVTAKRCSIVQYIHTYVLWKSKDQTEEKKGKKRQKKVKSGMIFRSFVTQ